MPVSGALDVAPLIAGAPRLSGFATEPWDVSGVELLQLKFEIDDRARTAALPPALHPTIPPLVIITVASYPDSPVGPFMLAQLRIECRASALPRGYLLRAYSDSAAACAALAERWGFDCRPADVRLRRFHDRIVGSVAFEGREVLRAALIDPLAISGADIQYVANMNLARSPEDDARGVLVQVDPEYRFHRAERGRPEVEFDAAAWAAAGIEPVWPVAASFALVDTGFPKIRFVLDPNRPALVGTKRIE